MARTWIVIFPILFVASFAFGQEASQSAPAIQQDSPSVGGKLYSIEDGVTTPALLPIEFPLPDNTECKTKLSGKLTLSFFLDEEGVPHSIAFEEGAGNGLDGLAYKILSADRLKPAIHDGSAVRVPMKGEITLDACEQQTPSSDGKTQVTTKLWLQPKQKFMVMTEKQAGLEFFQLQTAVERVASGSRDKTTKVTPPVPTNSVAATFSDEARRKKINGVCVVSLIVDTDGNPRSVRVRRPLGYSLDQQAVDAARRYRFKPAMKNGVPVPVMVYVEIAFRIY
jgi:TonB family protein